MDSTFNERPQMQCRLNLWLSEDLCFFCWTPTAWLSVATKVGVLKQLFIWVEPASVLANPFWSVNYWVSHNRTAKAATQMQNEQLKCKMNNPNANATTKRRWASTNVEIKSLISLICVFKDFPSVYSTYTLKQDSAVCVARISNMYAADKPGTSEVMLQRWHIS